MKSKDDTPAMRQYQHFKQQHPQCVLFFRMGDFYELFYDDAKLAHRVLGVTLTQRSQGIPMAGVPYHAVEGYLRRIIQAGFRVAVCDQVEDAKLAKGIVKRDVTRIITPGTLTDESLLEEDTENPLVAIVAGEKIAALAWTDLSTGSFSVASFAAGALGDELARIAPRELLYPEATDGQLTASLTAVLKSIGCPSVARPTWQFGAREAVETLHQQFQVKTLAGFGLDDDDPALPPASALIHYLRETQASSTSDERRLAHLQPPRLFRREDHLIIDQVSLRSLEVERTLRSNQTAGSLLGVLQDCRTAMGKRALRRWLCYPLAAIEPIERRQRVVGTLVDDSLFLDQLSTTLTDIQDVQRIVARIAVGRATPRDLVALGQSGAMGKCLADLLAQRPAVCQYQQEACALSEPLSELASAIATACVESPPAHLREGGLFRDGYDAMLDESHTLQSDSNAWLATYQKQLIDQTGIGHLKVGYNKVFGFYIELSAANRDRAPDDWIRKQTLKHAERFITPELKTYEGKVLTARQRGVEREQTLFDELCNQAQDYLHYLHTFAELVAELDVLACFARRAVRHRYVQPTLVSQPEIHICGGRHPVLDELLGDQFVDNDLTLGSAERPEAGPTLALITGPNMAGKSTYIRQTALMVLLAHTGSFVPADSATIGLCDRIFTRIGASDELHTGQSTFMVEMTETANICHHASDQSLVILDEIGRGTSTLDGLALAWAIAERLAARRCRTLFATHYHELTRLAEQFDQVINLNVTVREWQDQIVFLHRIVPGSTDRSYGIHVAKLAGLPTDVVGRANELLAQLQVSHDAPGSTPRTASQAADGQLSLFTEYLDHPVINQLRELDLQHLTPLEAFDTLRQLRSHLD